MKYQQHIIYLLCLLGLLTACDRIADDERLIEVDTPEQPDVASPAVKRVLLEDFTGQRCPNCPKGTEVIEQLEEAFGDRLIVVGIHGGPLGFKGTASVTGLATDTGDTYYDHWRLEYQPVGLIDRGGAVNYTDWTAAVSRAMERNSHIGMWLEATLSDGKISIKARERMLRGNYTGKLQLWVVEDGIKAIQTMPDGTNNREYVHQHVLRMPVNGIWGSDFSLLEGKTAVQSMEQEVDAAWNTARLSIVAFVYNDEGVAQAIKANVNAI